MPQATTAAATTPFDAILVQSRDLLRERLTSAMSGMFDAADAALTELSEKATEDEAKKRFADARDLASANREVVESQFEKRWTSEFQKRTSKAKKIGVSLSDISLDDMALVEEDDLEETLRFNDMAAKLKRHCEEELGALDQRIGVLLGDAGLESDDNPFGPQAICDAYKQACHKIEAPLDIRLVFLKLFDDHVADAIRSSYKDVNQLLIDNSILPKIRYSVTKNENKAPAPGAGLPEIEKPKGLEASQPPASPQDMFSQLAKLMGGGAAGGAGPAPGMGVGGVPVVQGAALMISLTNLQVGNLAALGDAAAQLGPILAEAGNLKNVLHQLKDTQVGQSMGQVDAMTLDIVAMLFDQLFDDPKIPIALKGLIGHLQLPMLKVAIADKELFTKKEHPARQLLDVLGQIGLRLPQDFGPENPLFGKLEKFIKELVDGFQEKMEIFDKVRAELEEIIAEQEAFVAQQMESSSKELELSERLSLAKVAAEDEIKKRVAGNTSLPRPIVRFLALQWIKYLVVVGARESTQGEGWKAALQTMDDLLASLVPKATMEERRGLARVIPGLLKRLRTGVAESGIEDAVSQAFFQELMKCHAELMHAAQPAAAPAAKGATESMTKKPAATDSTLKKPAATDSTLKKPAATDSTLKKPAAAASDSALKQPVADTVTKKPVAPAKAAVEDELDFTAPVEVNNPFGAGKVAVSSDDLDFSAAAQVPAGGVALAPAEEKDAKAAKGAKGPKRETIRLPSAMVVGAWVDVLDADGVTRQAGKLHYVSPMKSHFLFVDRKGRKVFECSRSMLARRIKLGEVTLLEGEPDASLFDRIMDGLFGKLRTGAPA
jgi:hypothetical protein